MWLDGESQGVVNMFWQLCGEIEPFPRRLERSMALALPITLIKLSHLKLRQVEGWLQRRGIAFSFGCQSRAVRGCLIAYGGEGMIFADGTDPEAEQRFTIAHEVAHFMVDYWQPRGRAIDKLGSTIIEVLDELRQSTIDERVHALLTSAPIGLHTNLMERSESSNTSLATVWSVEDRADKIALALLAPPEDILPQIDLKLLTTFEERASAVRDLMCGRFGLPLSVATAYSRSLLIAFGKGPSWVETLKLR